ncbi:MAG: hypothetical protein JXB30_09260, partial [Anaerolineae bacterium]|nr:hypothetical protein [Anaerolineae bacterium]
QCKGVFNMMQWPDFNDDGELPPGIYQASLAEVIEHFGQSTPQRQIMARRLEHIYTLANGTGHLGRFIVFSHSSQPSFTPAMLMFLLARQQKSRMLQCCHSRKSGNPLITSPPFRVDPKK